MKYLHGAGDDTTQERIMLGYVRNPETLELDGIRLAPFTPGTIIERCGNRYRVDAKGQQRRVIDGT